MMNQKYKISLLFSFFVCMMLSVQAQEEQGKWENDVIVGLNIGGTTPLPLPNEIRKVNTYNAGLNPTIAIRTTRWLDNAPQWGITTGLYVDYRGMEIDADVKYWNTRLQVGEGKNVGEYQGLFSGKNHTNMKNGYFTVPAMASYRPFNRWTFHLGGYVSWMHSSKFEGSAADGYICNGGATGDVTAVDKATFDFSNELKSLDAGIVAGADWKFKKRISVVGQLDWGLVPVFPSAFNGIPYKMYNIYFTLGLAYRL